MNPTGPLDALVAWFPRRVVDRLASGAPLAVDGQVDRFQAATLLADISGFTALAAELGDHGAAGAERLMAVLDGCFGPLVEAIHHSGGDVVDFQGDAVLGVWPTTADHDLQASLNTALRCAWRIHRAVDDGGLWTTHGLRLRIGIGVGEVCLLDLDVGRGRRMWLTAGPGPRQAVRAELAATPGQTVVSAQAAALLGLPADSALIGHGGHRVDTGADSLMPWPDVKTRGPRVALEIDPAIGPQLARSLRAYLPDALTRRLDAGHADWLAELRTVTTAFVGLAGLRPGSPDHDAAARQLFSRIGAVVHAHEGSLVKLLVNDWGTVVVVAFGLPPRAHADDAARAVAACLELVDVAAQADLKASVGVATGRVFCGAYGNRTRQDYTILGAPVNLAARLMQLVGEGAWCDSETARGASQRFAFEPDGFVNVQGMDDAVRVVRPVARLDPRAQLMAATGPHPVVTGPQDPDAERGRPRAGLVGRRAQLQALLGCLDGLASGESGLALLEGAPGMGKTRLLACLHDAANERGVRCVSSAGEPDLRRDPLHVWRGILSDLLDIDASTDPHQVGERLRALYPPGGRLERWFPLLGTVFDLDTTESELTSRMSGPQRADATRALLIEALRALCQHAPTVVVIDDAQWLDAASCELAASCRSVANLQVVLASRSIDSEQHRALALLQQVDDLLTIRVGPLADAQIVDLARRLLGCHALSPAVERAITARAAGSPFFCRELVYALSTSGQLVVNGGQADLRSGRRPDLPGSIAGLVTSRFDQLPADQQLTLQVAAVIGTEFEVDGLLAAHPLQLSAARLQAQLDQLVAADFLAPRQRADLGRRRFQHDVLRQACYDLLALPERRRLHLAFATWLEARRASPATTSRLAFHWLHGGEAMRAVDHLEKAGMAALQAGADRDAVGALQEAVSLVEQAQERREQFDVVRVAGINQALGAARLGLGELDQAGVALRRALRLLGADLPDSGPGWAAALVRELAGQLRWRLLPRWRRRPADADLTRLAIACRAAGWYSNLSYFRVDPLPWLVAGLASANLSEKVGDRSLAGAAFVNLSNIAGTLHLRAVERHYQVLAGESSEPRVGAMAFWSRAVVHLVHCEWAEARLAVAQGLLLSESVGDHWAIAQGLTIRGLLATMTRPLPQSRPIFLRAVATGRRHGNTEQEGYGLIFGVPALLAMGQVDTADASLQCARAGFDQLDHFSRVAWHGCRAGVRLRQNRLEEAVSQARQALDLFADRPLMVFTYAGPLSLTAETLVEAAARGDALGEHSVADLRRLRDRALGLMRQGALLFRYFRPRHRMLRATVDWHRGRHGAARRGWQRALAEAERWGLPLDSGRVHVEIARHLDPADPARGRHIAAARALLTSLEADGVLALLPDGQPSM